ncbi:MAG: hypothetical protein ACT4QA_09195, partial [Panacagrimonas sp.]
MPRIEVPGVPSIRDASLGTPAARLLGTNGPALLGPNGVLEFKLMDYLEPTLRALDEGRMSGPPA